MELFYQATLTQHDKELTLTEDTSKHLIAVLRKKQGEEINLTNGQGMLATCVITKDHKKQAMVRVVHTAFHSTTVKKMVVAVAFTRNNSRNEWMIEKLTELGCAAIVPLICRHSVKTNYRSDRFVPIAVSAMLQSQQTWLPNIAAPTMFADALHLYKDCTQRLIAHCNEARDRLDIQHIRAAEPTLLLIGPEGDFSGDEIMLAEEKNVQAISLGSQRLRTETAAIAAASFVRLLQ